MSRFAMLFPGQGAQEVGMGREFRERHAAAAEVFAEADAVLGYSLSKLCADGPIEELMRTEHAQPAIYVTSVAAVLALEKGGRLNRSTFAAAAGLSLGEYTALWFASVFDFADGLRLVRRRGLAMQAASEATPSGMVSLLGADRVQAEAVADHARGGGVLVVANLNGPGQVVLSGDRDACARVPEAARALGVRRAIPLPVAGAFHSPLMEPARKELVAALAELKLSPPRIPVYSNVTAEPIPSVAILRELLSQQVVKPVRWEESMRSLATAGCTSFVEPPPGRVLSALAKKILPEAVVTSLSVEGISGTTTS